ncbi:hypothetical protein FALBO_9278 [Fusarium albosuccineum]|uniref:Zn(2)-C6 fungal-type domain-containing protein n=1 Tax=Fusarium albosuccineum TaxID=1237068 RepID=A0A8H4L955_9HYPO|nr:hypothetical protein FALBO_9278 [Fusarium albosuccineum]
MSSRVSKRSARKTEERKFLSELVESSGTAADMPCSYCFKHRKECLMADDSARCSECIRRGRSCDGTRVASSLRKLISQEKKLDEDEEKAGEDLLKLHEELAALQARMAVAAGRLSRIRKTKTKVKERRATEFRRGIRGLESEDALSEELSRREDAVSGELQSLNPEGLDWESLGLGGFDFDPFSVDGSASEVAGHS